jgi:hypothetical protein
MEDQEEKEKRPKPGASSGGRETSSLYLVRHSKDAESH